MPDKLSDPNVAAAMLKAGKLVAFPTETVYGLGADATSSVACRRIFQAKGRPPTNPLIVHVADIATARNFTAGWTTSAQRLAEEFWPGPLTLVLPRAAGCEVAELATAGLETIAVRVPAHPVARAILQSFGKPVVAPSANVSGHVSPTTAEHVAADLSGRIDLIVDGGPAPVGLESTIVGCFARPLLLRPGGLPRSEIEAVLGERLAELPGHEAADQPLAPGMLASHYAPRSPVRLNATTIEPGEALLAFGSSAVAGVDKAAAVLNLSPRGDLVEAAANLFRQLRSLDAVAATQIAVMPVPNEGLGEAINDRLRRAAV